MTTEHVAHRSRWLPLLAVGVLLALVSFLALAGPTAENTAVAQEGGSGDEAGLTEGGVGAGAPEEPTEVPAEEPVDETGEVDVSATSRLPLDLTRDLDLESARVHSVNLDDTEEEYVVFAFADFVREIRDHSAFTVAGFSAATSVAATSADLLANSPSEVLVGFPQGTDLTRYTIATIATGAVANETGQQNVARTVALDGSTAQSLAGLVAGPELGSVATDSTLDRVSYTFDVELDPDQNADANTFGFYDAAGQATTATSVVTIDDETVTVQFDRRVENGVRFYAEPGAVTDRKGQTSLPASIGGSTTAPDLADVARPGSLTQIDFTFSDDITDIDPAAFAVYTASGASWQGTDYVRVDADTVRISFPEVRDFTSQIVLASALDGAVTANDGSRQGNTIGSLGLASANQELGRTSGPDLVGVATDTQTGQVRLLFDELLDDQRPIDPKGFAALTTSGQLLQARSVVEVFADSVLLIFDRNAVQAADGFVVDAGAVTDFTGEPNPAGTQ